jgi:hypothetical protein
MPRRKTKLLCGTCGATGSVLQDEEDKVCIACNGVGYSEVIHEDARTLDRIRYAQHQGSLRRFTAFIALLAGAAVSYGLIHQLDEYSLAVCLVVTSIVAYFILRLPWIASVLYVTMNFLKVLVGFVVISALIIGVTYLLFLLRQLGGW